jgi:hypothetical protein
MNKIFILAIMAIVLVSGCIDNVLLATLQMNVIDSAVEEISVIAEVPAFVREGQTFFWSVEINPKIDMKNISLQVYDKSPFFELSENQIDSWEISELKSNRTKIFQTSYVASEVEFDQDIEIKFIAEYDASTSLSEGYTILDDFEYEDRYSKGTLNNIDHESTSEKSPVKVRMTFDKDRPFMNDTRVLMYVDYSYSATGIIESLPNSSVTINIPSNLELLKCLDYRVEENEDGSYKLILDKEKTFLNKKSVQSTCEFQTAGSTPIATGTITLTAKYHYKVTGDASIELRKR